MRLDHVGLAVRDTALSRAFYEKALAPLGYRVLGVIPPQEMKSGVTAVMFGVDEPDFVIADHETPGEGEHIAFRADSRAQVDAFHAAALVAGGRDNSAPGLRPQYGPAYYAALVFDPDGFNIEAVRHCEP